MAGTRNKQTRGDYHMYTQELKRQELWNTPSILQNPAYPCSGINVQHAPANTLSNNSVDIETYLYGIGANNYIFPHTTPTLDTTPLPLVQFTPTTNVYIPRLPPYLQHQRP